MLYKNKNNTIYLYKNNKIKQAIGNLNQVKLDIKDKNIQIKYQTFNIKQGKYKTDTKINKTVDVYVDDVLTTTVKITKGEGLFEFKTSETGIFKIKIGNSEWDVVIK